VIASLIISQLVQSILLPAGFTWIDGILSLLHYNVKDRSC